MDDSLDISPNTLPNYYNLLSEEDKLAYNELRNELSSSERKFKRYKRVRSFQDALQLIYQFCIHHDSNDWKRCRGDINDPIRSLVCGICWIGYDIAINTRQLRILINKCKSSINGALAKMGYGISPIKIDSTDQLTAALPLLKGNFVEQRMWSVRKIVIASPAPYMALNYMSPYPISHPFVSPQPIRPSPPNTAQIPIKQEEISVIFGTKNPSTSFEQKPEIQNVSQNIQDNNIFPESNEITQNIQDNNILPESNEISFSEFMNNDITSDLDFLTDPCCCCPREWFTMNDKSEDIFSFA